MRVDSLRAGWVLWLVLNAGTPIAQAQEPPSPAASLVPLDASQLEQLYRNGTAAGLPSGRVRGTFLPATGTPGAALRSRGARAIWQGKIIHPEQNRAVNRFFGLPMVAAHVYLGTSWLDGNPALVLDYSQTSLVYRPYRDEIREVAPGVYLGLMFDRRHNPPTIKTYFAIESE